MKNESQTLQYMKVKTLQYKPVAAAEAIGNPIGVTACSCTVAEDGGSRMTVCLGSISEPKKANSDLQALSNLYQALVSGWISLWYPAPFDPLIQ